jgi:hypothetical protein
MSALRAISTPSGSEGTMSERARGFTSTSTSALAAGREAAREDKDKLQHGASKQAAAYKTKGFCQPPPSLGVALASAELHSTYK